MRRRAARHRRAQGRRGRSGAAELSRARRRAAPHRARLRSAAARADAASRRPTGIELAPGERKPIFLRQLPATSRRSTGQRLLARAARGAPRAARAPRADMTTVETSNELFNEVLCRSTADLAHADDRHAAGPLSLRRHSLVLDDVRARRPHHRAADAVVRSRAWRAACCGGSRHSRPRTIDPPSDAEPGKILHEMRGGEMAALGEVPFGLYYGSVDSTPLFVLLAGLYVERTGDDGDAASSCGRRSRRRCAGSTATATRIGDGFVEYYRETEKGLANQGWKDSHDAVFHADGRLAEGPIALVEVQGYVFAAKRLRRACAAATRARGSWRASSRAGAARSRSDSSSILVPELGTYALALDGDEAAVPRAHLECRPGAVHRHRAPGSRRAWSRTSSACARASSPAGASARSRAARRATIRCRITTARSGRTTMR